MSTNIVRFAFLIFFTACYTATPVATPKKNLSILQGATDETSTQINVFAPVNTNYTFSVSFDNSLLEAPLMQIQTHPGSQTKVLQLQIENLTADLTYTLRVYEGNEIDSKNMVDERFFRTLPKNWKQARIFVISCTDDSYEDLQKRQWKQIFEQKPDVLFLIGDSVYVDGGAIRLTSVGPDDIWRRYSETATRLDLYKSKSLTPVFATWDDHDYGINDGGMNFEHKLFSQTVFKTFFPMKNNAVLESGPGVASALKIGSQQFLFLDDRSFRTPKNSKPQSHFGHEQQLWLVQKIKNHNGPTWLISGDQFFGAYHRFESFEGHHPEDFKSFLKELDKTNKTLLFLSGDRHLSEFIAIERSQLGHKTVELTSSGLHARMHPGSASQFKNKRRIFAKDGLSNYLDLKIDLENKKGAKFDAEVWSENFATIHRQSFHIFH